MLSFCISIRFIGQANGKVPHGSNLEVCGAMDRLISDNAKAQILDQVKEILRTFCIKDWQSEPYKVTKTSRKGPGRI